jgi:hypothetical protein
MLLKAVASPVQKSVRMCAAEPLPSQESYVLTRGGLFGQGTWTVKSGTTGATLFCSNAKITFNKSIIKPQTGSHMQQMKLQENWFTFESMSLTTTSGKSVAQITKKQDIMAQCYVGLIMYSSENTCLLLSR